MTKQDAIKMIGGGSKAETARAMGYKNSMAVYMWPDVLPRSIADRVLGVWVRKNLSAAVPKEFSL